jgi:hypothetical protein
LQKEKKAGRDEGNLGRKLVKGDTQRNGLMQASQASCRKVFRSQVPETVLPSFLLFLFRFSFLRGDKREDTKYYSTAGL